MVVGHLIIHLISDENSWSFIWFLMRKFQNENFSGGLIIITTTRSTAQLNWTKTGIRGEANIVWTNRVPILNGRLNQISRIHLERTTSFLMELAYNILNISFHLRPKLIFIQIMSSFKSCAVPGVNFHPNLKSKCWSDWINVPSLPQTLNWNGNGISKVLGKISI